MPYRLNIFNKILILVILLMIPILLLYSYSNRITNNVIQDQIQLSNLNQLSFFSHQLDSGIEQLSMFPVLLGYDPYIREFIDRTGTEPFDVLKARSRITEKLSLQSVSSGWSNDLTLVLPADKTVISSSIFLNGTDVWSWKDRVQTTWTYELKQNAGKTEGTFNREIAEPFSAKFVAQARAIFQVRFSSQNIEQLLDIYKRDKKSDPFLFNRAFDPVLNSTSSVSIVDDVGQALRKEALKDSGQLKADIGGQQYLVSYVKSQQLGWYLVDYVPVERILSPIIKTRQLFYGTIALLLILSVLASFLLYRNVHIPILKMIRGLQRMKRGDLSARIEYRSNNEFNFLIQRFNEMGAQIQVLVEDVYAEKIRSREATLKQLQSQINPHFLYNSLFFIINSAEMEDRESVVLMAQNLAEFYRYTTRVESQTVTIREELDFVRHYLNIQGLRMHRLQFTINVPDSMLDERVPRLILQPIVENAIVHGIERKLEGDLITIFGEQNETCNRLVVEDNGCGLSEEELTLLSQKLDAPMSDEIGCGTWNVHKRLYYQFGEGSGLTFQHGTNGGLRVILTWNRKGMERSEFEEREG